MKSTYFLEVQELGQIGAGRIVPFPFVKPKKKWIPLPKGARSFDQFREYEVCGDSLEELRIYDGDLLTCRTNFEISEVKPNKICIVYIVPKNEQTAKMVQINGDGTVTLLGANPKYKPQIYFVNEIQILALVDEVRFKP